MIEVETVVIGSVVAMVLLFGACIVLTWINIERQYIPGPELPTPRKHSLSDYDKSAKIEPTDNARVANAVHLAMNNKRRNAYRGQ